jgi:hypothetical protein
LLDGKESFFSSGVEGDWPEGWRDALTARNQPDVFTPGHRDIEISASALITYLHFLHRSVPAEELLLLVPERGTCFYQVDLLNAGCKGLEVADCLRWVLDNSVIASLWQKL